MIATDTNILVAAHRRDHLFHQTAFSSLKQLAEGGGSWGLPYHALVEFYGIVTHPRIWKTPSTPKQAWHQIELWCACPSLVILYDNDATQKCLRNLCDTSWCQGAAVHDARIASLCIGHKVKELWSFDRDFSRFPALKTRNPTSRP